MMRAEGFLPLVVRMHANSPCSPLNSFNALPGPHRNTCTSLCAACSGTGTVLPLMRCRGANTRGVCLWAMACQAQRGLEAASLLVAAQPESDDSATGNIVMRPSMTQQPYSCPKLTVHPAQAARFGTNKRVSDLSEVQNPIPVLRVLVQMIESCCVSCAVCSVHGW